jgi:hypothetical protein
LRKSFRDAAAVGSELIVKEESVQTENVSAGIERPEGLLVLQVIAVKTGTGRKGRKMRKLTKESV